MSNTRRPPTLLDTPAAAKALGVRPRTLEDWRRRGGGPPYVRLSATRVRYHLDSLEAWLQSRTATCTAEEVAREPVIRGGPMMTSPAPNHTGLHLPEQGADHLNPTDTDE